MFRVDQNQIAAELARIGRLRNQTDSSSSEYRDYCLLEATLKWVADPYRNSNPSTLVHSGKPEAIVVAPNLRAGDRVRLSDWGRAVHPHIAHREVEGTVQRVSKKYARPLIIWDDRKAPVVINATCLDRINS